MIKKTVRIKTEQPPAEGWPYVEDCMKTYDDGVMEDYAEDVDTLLVLDGLFSAVVTAFVVPAYALLQQDNSQVSVVLLSQISTQLSNLTLISPHINGTVIPSILGATTFHPATAARWINSLWFLSLILSLTSAVLGILAKQWIREYLKWNTATGAPKDNILVRQIRTEAWDDWHAPALIASIPALLELAIVLFVCGLTIFLWTLDFIVAIIVTISVVNFLLLITILTALPTMFKRCPYRSPTAWAFLALWKLSKRHVLSRLSYRFYSADGQDRDGVRYGWRHRDLESIRIHALIDSSGDVVSDPRVVLEDLETEMKDVLQPLWDSETARAYVVQIFEQSPESQVMVPTSTIDQQLAIMGEPDFLIRALSWITATSQDLRLLQQLPQCSELMHSPNLTYPIDVTRALVPIEKPTEIPNKHLVELMIARGFRHLTIFHLLARLCMPWDSQTHSLSDDPWSLDDALRLNNPWHLSDPWRPNEVSEQEESKKPTGSLIGSYVLERFRTMYSVSLENVICLTRDIDAGRLLIDVEPSVSQRHLLSYLLVSETKAAVLEMLSPELLEARCDRKLLLLFSRQVVELLCGLGVVTLEGRIELPTAESYGRDCLQELVELYNTIARHPAKSHFDCAFPGLRSSFLYFLSDYARLQFTEGNAILAERLPSAPIAAVNATMSHGRMDTTSTWLSLADMFSLDQSNTTREDYNIFAFLISRTFLSKEEGWRRQPPRRSAIAGVYNKATTFLHRAAELGWRNGGSYFPLDWFVTPDERSSSNAMTGEEPLCNVLYRHAPDEFMSLLHAVEKHHLVIDNSSYDLRYMVRRLLPSEESVHSATRSSQLFGHYSLLLLEEDIADPLAEWTTLIRRFRSARATSGPGPWPHFFIWAANQWLLAIGQHVVSLPIDRRRQHWMSISFTDVLNVMAASIDIATEQHEPNAGYQDQEFPWLSSIFISHYAHPEELRSYVSPLWPKSRPRTYAPIVLLEWFAPAALRLFARSMTRALDSGNLSGSSAQDDIRLLHSYLNATPPERKAMVQRRQLSAQASSSSSEADNLSLLRALPCFLEPLGETSRAVHVSSSMAVDAEPPFRSGILKKDTTGKMSYAHAPAAVQPAFVSYLSEETEHRISDRSPMTPPMTVVQQRGHRGVNDITADRREIGVALDIENLNRLDSLPVAVASTPSPRSPRFSGNLRVHFADDSIPRRDSVNPPGMAGSPV